MNRKERRELEKRYRHIGLTKTQAKEMVNANHRTEAFKKGQKCKLNYEFIIRHPQYKKQKDDFKSWIEAHRTEVFTVDEVRDNGYEVTFVEDDSTVKYWHHVETLTPLATATIKLDDGTEKSVLLDGVTSTDDTRIQEKINKALEE